jgi:hypothetical protein
MSATAAARLSIGMSYRIAKPGQGIRLETSAIGMNNNLGLDDVAVRKRLRRLTSRTLYALPPRWQMYVKAIKRFTLRQHDWARSTQELRLLEHDYLTETVAQNNHLPNRKRIAIYSLHHFSPVEYGLSMALHLRGHDVQGILCDGLLPLCEMNLGPNIRPPCEACIMNLSRYEDAFGFHYDRLKNFLSDKDQERAEQLVAETADDALSKLEVNGVPVGRFARREIQRYYRGFIFDPPRDPAFRKWLVSAVLLTWLSERWLDAVKPDIVGVCSGRTLPTACLFEVARQRGIHVVTWDGVATRPDGLMFSHNHAATEVPLDDAWKETANEPLSAQQIDELDAFLSEWARSRNTPFPYNLNPLEDQTLIRSELGLRSGVPLIAAFTNTSWDIAVIDRDVGFESMFDWIFSLVEYAINHPEIDLVVRAHPAEKNVPIDLRSRTPVGPEIRKRFQPLPSNVKIIEGDNPISSYSLAKMAQVNMVYASRFGLEIALRGMRPWIAGDVTYRGKGFSLDLTSKKHMFSLLDTYTFDNQLSEAEIKSAQRFAYLWFFRYEVRLPLLHPPNKRFMLSTFRDLGPGGNPIIDNLCDAFVSGRPFIDMGAPNPTPELTPRVPYDPRSTIAEWTA